MANPLLQKARQRKMIYFGAIVALFTLSLIHREFVIKPQAIRLQLRETSRGEVELTSSAVRLLMTGSRGLAVTMLWYTAMDKQKRSEWNELELVVKSITKLQPYFITPWLYQSWNLSFNVAVECDRPRDKYYYISRGLELLAEGERRNSGTGDQGVASDPDLVIPGNPELRQFMGFIYQLKIGNSDERLTMRSLLEMSCIDPVQRNPERFWTTNEKGQKVVDMTELAKFCQKYPRLVRRLHEQLEYSDPPRIVQFLQDNQNIPNRFKPSKQANIPESELKSPLDQFPILPPKDANWPDPKDRNLTGESIDVFLICRTWYEYAQKPLPDPEKNPRLSMPVYDKLRHRVPKGMMLHLFRQYPARAQVYIAETLESEGFFDGDGWDMSAGFKKWFSRRDLNPADYTYGTDSKYHSRLAWERGYDRFMKFGIENGIYISPGEVKELTELATEVRKKLNLKPDQNVAPTSELRYGKLRKSYEAHQKLVISAFYNGLCNFDAFLYQAEAESDPLTVVMRKKLFVAERKRRRDTPSESMVELFEESWDLYLQVCFKYPRFAQVETMQEDLYEIHLRSLGITRSLNREKFKQTVLWAAKIAYWPVPSWQESIVQFTLVSERKKDQLVIERKDEQQEILKIFPIRKTYGPLDLVQYYDGPATKELPAAKELKEVLFIASQLASYPPHMGVAAAVAFPNGHQNYLLTRRTAFLEINLPPHWRPLIDDGTRYTVMNRLGITR